MLKFPGGGHEFGEGLKETLIREFKEELSLEVEVGDLFYVNDFAQISAFHENHQLISFYFFGEVFKNGFHQLSNQERLAI